MKPEVRPPSQQLYELLLKLYPKRFREQFGDEMKVVFAESLLDVREQAGSKGMVAFWTKMLVDLVKSVIREQLAEREEGVSMSSSKFISPNTAAVLGFLLLAPGALLISMLMLNIEPTVLTRLLPPVPEDQPQVANSLIALTLIVILPAVGLTLNLVQLRRIRRSGGTVLEHPMNLALALACFALIATLAIGLIIDQWPCWQGVPNCD
jgi:hypothetical protein